MKMEFGVALGSNLKMEDIAGHARTAEENGFTHLGFVDQPLQDRDAWVSMTVAALNTKHILIGQSVTDPFTYHPLVIANATASVNELSGGRAFVGIGAGGAGAKAVFKPVPLKELREAVDFIQKYSAGEEAEFKGVWAHRGAESKLHSVWSNERLPVYWAAAGLKSVELAGEIADGVIIPGANPEMVRTRLALIEKGAMRAGRDPSKIDVRVNTSIFVADSKEAAHSEVASFAATFSNGHYRWSQRNPELARCLERASPGILEEFKRIHEAYDVYQHERPGAPHADLVSQRVVDFFHLTGKPEDICEGIHVLQQLRRDSGLCVTCIEAAVYTVTDQIGVMKEMGSQILPYFRE